ncbi:MAG: 30S ribosomal protein S8 [Candidatus Saccharimonadales bacterium]
MSVTTTDPIADMLTRIRNANLVRKAEISLPHSKIKEALARILKQNGFIEKLEVKDGEVGKILQLQLSSQRANNPITEITRLSKPGSRHYARSSAIPVVKRGRGIVIISTSQGMMTGDQAKRLRLGGELICKVY